MMWNTNTLWFEIAVLTIFFLLGHIFLGHFEERSPKWRKLVKYLASIVIVLSLSFFFGRIAAFGFLGIGLFFILYVHGILLPKKGINGWTGEPKSKYYEFRGWSKDIFENEKKQSPAK